MTAPINLYRWHNDLAVNSPNEPDAVNEISLNQVAASDIELIDAGFRYAFSMTHHLQDAEDLIQQACLRVFRRKGSLVNRGYLFVVIRNIFCDGCRRRSLLTFERMTEDPAREIGNAEAHRNDAKLDLEAILATLKSSERELLYLHSIEGFTAREISEVTRQPRGTVLSQLARIKHKLADRFGGSISEEKQSR